MVAAAMAARAISESMVDVDGVRVFVRRSDGEGTPVVFAHGNPTHSADWVPFMEGLERPAIAFDLPGWGRSETPSRRKFDYSMHGLARFFGRALETLGVEERLLVVHDWGGLALIDALARPNLLERLVIMDSLALVPDYEWHWIAKYFWRVPVSGELFNLLATKSAFRLLSRQAFAKPGPMPPEFIDMVWGAWRGGFSRHVLDLYRSGDPDELAAAGVGLGELDCPALILWGAQDPYISPRYGSAYAERLPQAELVVVEDAGHWPWIDRPDVIGRVNAFLDAG
jgi:pimeloyl-ACP methyl ester carboxylesterase